MIELKTAKYKGVEFLFEEMTTTGGNRLIKFNYPGSDVQAIERQGKAPRSFSLPAIIPHDDYYQKRDELLRVLEDGAAGVLTHPTFGDIDNVYSGTYTLTENTTSLGRATITIQFEIHDAEGIPVQSGNLVTQVQAESDSLELKCIADIENGYFVTESFSGNFQDAVDQLKGINSAIDNAIQLASPQPAMIADAVALSKAFGTQINKLIGQPASIASSIMGMFYTLNELYATPAQTLVSLRSMFKFGKNDVAINKTTASKIERSKNRDILNAAVNVMALNLSYLNAVQVEYQTTEDLDLIQGELESQYLYVRDTNNVSNETIEQLDLLRVQSLKTLDNVRVNTRQIITVNVTRQPLSVLTYAYYGNTDLVDTLSEMNGVKRNAFVEGNIRILTV